MNILVRILLAPIWIPILTLMCFICLIAWAFSTAYDIAEEKRKRITGESK